MRWSQRLLSDRKSWGARAGLVTDDAVEAGEEKVSRAQRLLRAKLGLMSEGLEERQLADSQSRSQRGEAVRQIRLDQGSERELVLARAGWALPLRGRAGGLQGHIQELEEQPC